MFIGDLSIVHWVKNANHTLLHQLLTDWWDICDFVSESMPGYVQGVCVVGGRLEHENFKNGSRVWS